MTNVEKKRQAFSFRLCLVCNFITNKNTRVRHKLYCREVSKIKFWKKFKVIEVDLHFFLFQNFGGQGLNPLNFLVHAALLYSVYRYVWNKHKYPTLNHKFKYRETYTNTIVDYLNFIFKSNNKVQLISNLIPMGPVYVETLADF